MQWFHLSWEQFLGKYMKIPMFEMHVTLAVRFVGCVDRKQNLFCLLENKRLGHEITAIF